jgi:hypothetical protein
MPSRNQKTVLSSLAAAHAQVGAAQNALAEGELLQAVARLEEARALQREAVAALVAGCWQDAMAGAGGDDGQRREEALADLGQLASAVLNSLCPACSEKIAGQLRAGEG